MMLCYVGCKVQVAAEHDTHRGRKLLGHLGIITDVLGDIVEIEWGPGDRYFYYTAHQWFEQIARLDNDRGKNGETAELMSRPDHIVK